MDPPIIGEAIASNYAVEIPAGHDSLDRTFIPDTAAIDAVQVFGFEVVERD